MSTTPVNPTPFINPADLPQGKFARLTGAIILHDERFQCMGDLGSGYFKNVSMVRTIKPKETDTADAAAHLRVLSVFKEPITTENSQKAIQSELGLIGRVSSSKKPTFLAIAINIFILDSFFCCLYPFFSKTTLFKGFYIDNLPELSSISNIRKIELQLFEAIQFLHKLNIVHKDVKLENVLLKEDGSCRIQIIDFGSIVFTDDSTTEMTPTIWGMTRNYISPIYIDLLTKKTTIPREQLNDALMRNDLFAMLLIFYELNTRSEFPYQLLSKRLLDFTKKSEEKEKLKTMLSLSSEFIKSGATMHFIRSLIKTLFLMKSSPKKHLNEKDTNDFYTTKVLSVNQERPGLLPLLTNVNNKQFNLDGLRKTIELFVSLTSIDLKTLSAQHAQQGHSTS